MDVTDFNHDEQLALVALIAFVAESNSQVTEEEADEIRRIAGTLGRERYSALTEEVDQRFADEDELKAFLETISRQEARELIFGIALETALSDADMLRHSEMIDWLRDTWHISVEVSST